MQKLLKIYGLKVLNTKYGQRTIVSGVLYVNVDKNFVGHQTYEIWVNAELKPEDVGKDLYVSFNALGKICATEVR